MGRWGDGEMGRDFHPTALPFPYPMPYAPCPMPSWIERLNVSLD
ncbi:hypothetical protein [Nostoc linckia]|nr:hypothetical protein [Nostoc linckia]